MTVATLDPSQQLASNVPIDERQIVIAGPGSGKTQVVSALVEHLVGEEGADPTYGVLVISFSNAAVHAVDARLRAQGIPPAQVQTLDSLAADFVREESDADVGVLSFDERIRLADSLLRKSGWQRLQMLDHVIVDEFQDIVGDRADFLLRLLKSLSPDAGFTVLGDPAQGIYDFQLRESAGSSEGSATTSSDLLEAVRRFRGVSVRELTGQHRAQSREAKSAAALRGSVLAGGSDLDRFMSSIARAGDVAALAPQVNQWQGSTCFLTSNNGQALLVADTLEMNGVDAVVERGPRHAVVAAWVARVMNACGSRFVSREKFMDAASNVAPNEDPSELWRAVRAISGATASDLDVEVLARSLTRRRPLLPALQDRSELRVRVSTIHRAKGLEFDNVVLVNFLEKHWLAPGPDQDVARTSFVAVTRARRLLASADGPDDRMLRRVGPKGHTRWFVSGPKSWMTFGVELRPNDFERSEPPGDDAASAQAVLNDLVALRGVRLQFRLDPRRSSLKVPVYAASVDDAVVAHTSQEFGEDLARRIGDRQTGRSPWPALGDARLESIGTVASSAKAGEVGRHGLWLAPVAAGMVQVRWDSGS
ncbi:UvrD-helicase domain-containing protein [Leifsonia sp. EB34]|uniref:UvrD-helicase domain-containing protein n=1 Tax=Leifsonia sp. EB34 TaxID=3156303 RepID=UPI0035129002